MARPEKNGPVAIEPSPNSRTAATSNQAVQRYNHPGPDPRNSIGGDFSSSGGSDTTSQKHYGSWITAVPEPTIDTTFIIMHSMNAVNALFVISDILNLTCSQIPRTYRPATPGPSSLFPTELQRTIPHHGYIDMIPFPIIRDRILETLAVINEEELCHDLQSDEWKIWGKKPWEPKSWEFSGEFVLKWWFLLDDEILMMTNFWRMQRQEEPLKLPHKAEAVNALW